MTEEYNEIEINPHTASDDAIEELMDLLEETTRRLDEQPSLEEKQELALKRLDKILNWNLEHGYFETLFPIFQEFITYVPEDKLNSFFKLLGQYSAIRVE